MKKNPRRLLRFIFSLFKHNTIYNEKLWKSNNLVSDSRIRTHNLLNTSLLQELC